MDREEREERKRKLETERDRKIETDRHTDYAHTGSVRLLYLPIL